LGIFGGGKKREFHFVKEKERPAIKKALAKLAENIYDLAQVVSYRDVLLPSPPKTSGAMVLKEAGRNLYEVIEGLERGHYEMRHMKAVNDNLLAALELEKNPQYKERISKICKRLNDTLNRLKASTLYKDYL
jgi:hypothetical protein